MSDTLFVPGTVVRSTWLNDVNNHVYKGKDFSGISVVNVKDPTYGAKGDGITNDTIALQTAITNNPGKTIYIPKGTYNINAALDLRGWYGEIVGDGMVSTIIRVTSAVTSALNIFETADVMISPLGVSNLTINGNSLTTNGYNIRYRHHTNFENLVIQGCTNGGQEKDCWLSTRKNVRYTTNTIDLWLVGSNHSSHWDRCAFTNATSKHVLIQSAGTALDGNSGLLFSACDVEFGSGDGYDITATDVSIIGGYTGENISGNVIINRGGIINVNGGTNFFGFTTSSYLVNPIGGKTTVLNGSVNGQTNGGIIYMIAPGANPGRVSFRDIAGNTVTGGNPVIAGTPLDYGPAMDLHTYKNGRAFTASTNNTTISTATINNVLTATCLTAPGPNPLISINAPTVNPSQWRAGERMYLVIEYASTKPVNFYLSNAAFGGSYLLANAPSTGGVLSTLIQTNTVAPTTAYSLFEGVLQSVAGGDIISIGDVRLADSTEVNALYANLGNLSK
jgi:hypothetical protein